MRLIRELRELRNVIRGDYYQKSFSQEGEDMILRRFLNDKVDGFYVDVGAHHPMRFSNTYYFYKKGWSGINIDAMPGSMNRFKCYRPRDINLEYAVSSLDQDLTYTMFNDPALNGFVKSLSDDRETSLPQYHLIGTKAIRTKTLSSILDQYMPQGKKIDFMSVDVEGLDLFVLQSNDWSKYKPTMILVEALQNNGTAASGENTGMFLRNHGYQLVAKTYNTEIYSHETRRK